MGIDADFSVRTFEQFLNAVPQIIKEEIIRAFSYLGEQCVRRVRDRSGEESWFDQTGNLRSSIGYAVYENGNIEVESSFSQVGKGSEGTSQGRKVVIELAREYANNHFTLVILAGMEYAEYVEAMQGKNVLASTELWARGEVDHYLQKAIERAETKISKLQKQLGL